MKILVLALSVAFLAAGLAQSKADQHNRGICPPSICNASEYDLPEREDRVEPTPSVTQCETQYLRDGEYTLCYTR
jgi:hypothetical protein